MTQRTCLLCSKLSSAYSRFRDYFSQIGKNCRRVNIATNEDKARVSAVNSACPDCLCEKYRTSRYSPGPVSNAETLTRFVFSPVHVGKTGNIKPSVFSHVFTVGCSVQRESIVSERELTQFAKKYLENIPTHSWHGVLTGNCEPLREYSLENTGQRALCIYDTAEKDNPAHSEIHCSQYVVDEADKVELRAKLFEVFNSGVHTPPSQYRYGSVLANIRST